MELSEEAKKLLEGSEEGKKILAGLAQESAEAAKSLKAMEELKAALADSEADKKKLLDSLLDPDKLAELSATKPTNVAPDDGELDFDNMDMPTLGRLLLKKLDEQRGTILGEVESEIKKFGKGLQGYLLNSELDKLRRVHKLSGSEVDFDEVVYKEMEERAKKNPHYLASQLYDETLEGLKAAELAKKEAERQAEAEQAEKERELWHEKPGEALSKVAEADEIPESAEGVAEIARRIGAKGNLADQE